MNTCEYVIDYGSRYVDPEPPELCGEFIEEDELYCDDHAEFGYLDD